MTILTTGPSVRRGGRNPGFTLLELVLVMVIICTVLGMASVSLRGFFASRRTADAAAQLVALTQYARSQAAAEGRTYRLNLEADDGRYWLTAQSGGAFETISSEFGRVFRLPENTAVETNATETEENTSIISFFSDGRSVAVTIRLTGRQNDVFDVICPSPAEEFRVEIPEEGALL